MTHLAARGQGTAPDRTTDSAVRAQWLEREVQILEEKISFFDELSFKIKGWGVTVWSAIVTIAVTQDSWQVGTLALPAVCAFLLLEASYKRYQSCFVERTRDIMRYLNDPTFRAQWSDARPFPVYDMLNIHTKGQQHDPYSQRWGSVGRLLFKASVGLIYWGLLVVSLLVVGLLAYT